MKLENFLKYKNYISINILALAGFVMLPLWIKAFSPIDDPYDEHLMDNGFMFIATFIMLLKVFVICLLIFVIEKIFYKKTVNVDLNFLNKIHILLIIGGVLLFVLPLLVLLGSLITIHIFDKDINAFTHKDIYRKGLY